MKQKEIYQKSAIIQQKPKFMSAEMMYLVHTGRTPAPCAQCFYGVCCSMTLVDADLMGCDIANDAIWVEASEIIWDDGREHKGARQAEEVTQPTTTKLTDKEWIQVYDAVWHYYAITKAGHDWMTDEEYQAFYSAFLKIRLRVKGNR